jgi:hypothetical protein
MNVYVPSYAQGLNHHSCIAVSDENNGITGYIGVFSNMRVISFTFLNGTLMIEFEGGYTAYFYEGGQLALLRLPCAKDDGIVVIDWFVMNKGVLKHGAARVRSDAS